MIHYMKIVFVFDSLILIHSEVNESIVESVESYSPQRRVHRDFKEMSF